MCVDHYVAPDTNLVKTGQKIAKIRNSTKKKKKCVRKWCKNGAKVICSFRGLNCERYPITHCAKAGSRSGLLRAAKEAGDPELGLVNFCEIFDTHTS